MLLFCRVATFVVVFKAHFLRRSFGKCQKQPT